ncbi:unnamed protein product [Aphanomyces euteiches]
MPGHKKFLETVPYTAPAWTSQLASPPSERVVLGNFPTPIFPFRPPGLPHDVQMYIKRDDYSGLEMSGNKARKLEFLLAEALKEGADCVVTCGGVQSNHCRATAVAARMLGLDSYLLLRTNDADVNDDPGLVGNLLVDRLVGANLIVVPRREYAKRGGGDYFIAKTCERLRAQGRKPYAIPVGGSNGLGTWGYIESIEEIESQIEALDMTVTDIAFACGSGGSAAGIAVGAYLYAKYNEESALQFTREGLPPGLGYAKSTQEELEYISKVARETGVLLDPVYSGKALFGLIKELQTTPEKFAGKHILFVHTGGMFGLYDKVAELQPGVLASRDISLFQLED